MAQKFKIKKGDRVVVITGREKGKSGEVTEVMRAENRVIVQGVNMVKKTYSCQSVRARRY